MGSDDAYGVENFNPGNITTGRPRTIKYKFAKNVEPYLLEPATAGSSGIDLRSSSEKRITINPGESALIPTGLFIELPNLTEAQIRSRSGLAARNNVFVLNSPGTIDCIPLHEKIKTPEGYFSLQYIIENSIQGILSFNEQNNVEEEDKINSVWAVGEKDTFEIEFEDGTKIITTENQLLLTPLGWEKVSDLKEKSEVYSLK